MEKKNNAKSSTRMDGLGGRKVRIVDLENNGEEHRAASSGSGKGEKGKRRIVIGRIEDEKHRSVTFSKRKHGLLKKAMELAILCDCEVGVMVFGNNGKLTEFASSSQQHVLERYAHYSGSVESRSVESFWEKSKWKSHVNIPRDHPELSAAALQAARAAVTANSAAVSVAPSCSAGPCNEELSSDSSDTEAENTLHTTQINPPNQNIVLLKQESNISADGEETTVPEQARKRRRTLSVEIPQTPARDTRLNSAQLRNKRILDAVLASGGRARRGLRSSGLEPWENNDWDAMIPADQIPGHGLMRTPNLTATAKRTGMDTARFFDAVLGPESLH
mmetsp:Transcript_3522/g.6164  ORF Transcript_3522/g.6164 Transcript_3522/m.6164 type:complete len:333 (-) Transcript_3522:772-1770(-)|eukprot:CAMPEP_0182446394 /NCGR_PEP_ID=MMETSP1172-20130603/4172_1 /TAXON_ID=708627 /ORGANISM="Timspurckia oligopyrenoides, Strain CCMP3278" /LENGTH=332 /DNA_ID=CAMNT_0024642321 /DNA_START=115 /DNA_END=1113 /DNA_ORIENTATION=+